MPEDSGKGNCRHGRRPQPAAARPRRPKARKADTPAIKPTARQFAGLRRCSSLMHRPRAYYGCWGAPACVCAPSSRAHRTSQGAHGAPQGRTNNPKRQLTQLATLQHETTIPCGAESAAKCCKGAPMPRSFSLASTLAAQRPSPPLPRCGAHRKRCFHHASCR